MSTSVGEATVEIDPVVHIPCTARPLLAISCQPDVLGITRLAKVDEVMTARPSAAVGHRSLEIEAGEEQ